MPVLVWEPGEMFRFSKGYGVYLGDNVAVLVEVQSKDYQTDTISRGRIPEDAQPVSQPIPPAIEMALIGALVAAGLHESVDL